MFCPYTRPPDTNTLPHSFTCLRVIAHIAQTKRQGACHGVRTQRPLRHASSHALHCTICVLAHAWLDHPIQTGQCRADNADADGCTDVNMNNERGETTRSLSLAGLSTAVPRKIRPTHAYKASGEFGNPCMHGAVSSRLSPHRRLNTAPCTMCWHIAKNASQGIARTVVLVPWRSSQGRVLSRRSCPVIRDNGLHINQASARAVRRCSMT